MKKKPEILWFILDLDGRRLGQLTNDSYEKVVKIACTILHKKPDEIQIVDSGHKKPRCCNKR